MWGTLDLDGCSWAMGTPPPPFFSTPSGDLEGGGGPSFVRKHTQALSDTSRIWQLWQNWGVSGEKYTTGLPGGSVIKYTPCSLKPPAFPQKKKKVLPRSCKTTSCKPAPLPKMPRPDGSPPRLTLRMKSDYCN